MPSNFVRAPGTHTVQPESCVISLGSFVLNAGNTYSRIMAAKKKVGNARSGRQRPLSRRQAAQGSADMSFSLKDMDASVSQVVSQCLLVGLKTYIHRCHADTLPSVTSSKSALDATNRRLRNITNREHKNSSCIYIIELSLAGVLCMSASFYRMLARFLTPD